MNSINNRVSMEEVRRLKARLAEINAIPFMKIEWWDAGEVQDFSRDLLEEYRVTGLNNADFVMTEFWKDGWDDTKTR